jgi:hypothetical protein
MVKVSMASSSDEKIVLNNFAIQDARSLVPTLQELFPDVPIKTGEEHAAFPPEWIEIALYIGRWLLHTAPTVAHDMAHGALTATGGYLVKVIVDRKKKSTAAEGLSQTIKQSAAKRVQLSTILENGKTLLYSFQVNEKTKIEEQIKIFDDACFAIANGHLVLPDIQTDNYVLVSDKRATRIVWMGEDGKKSSIRLRQQEDAAKVTPSKKGRKRG